jgi:4-hydroxy-3-methylbut-2-enyl diphosphate reductase
MSAAGARLLAAVQGGRSARSEAQSSAAEGRRPSSRLLLAAPMRLEARLVSSGARRSHVHRTGMGPRNAMQAAQELAALPGEALLVVGFCGALHSGLRPGGVVLADRVYTAEDEGHCRLQVSCARCEGIASALREAGLAVDVGPIVSVAKLALGRRREELHRKGACAVDMESAWLAAGAAGRPFAVVRIVLDTPQQELLRVRMIPIALRAGDALRRVARTIEDAAERLGLPTLFAAGASAGRPEGADGAEREVH